MDARTERTFVIKPWESDEVCPRCGFFFWLAVADHPEDGWRLYRTCDC